MNNIVKLRKNQGVKFSDTCGLCVKVSLIRILKRKNCIAAV